MNTPLNLTDDSVAEMAEVNPVTEVTDASEVTRGFETDNLEQSTQEASCAAPTESAPDPAPAPEMPDVERLIAEAEQRGYLRGRNEVLRQRLTDSPLLAEAGVGPHEPPRSPAEEPAAPATGAEVADEMSSRFLSRIRPSVWDL